MVNISCTFVRRRSFIETSLARFTERSKDNRKLMEEDIIGCTKNGNQRERWTTIKRMLSIRSERKIRDLTKQDRQNRAAIRGTIVIIHSIVAFKFVFPMRVTPWRKRKNNFAPSYSASPLASCDKQQDYESTCRPMNDAPGSWTICSSKAVRPLPELGPRSRVNLDSAFNNSPDYPVKYIKHIFHAERD